MPRLLGREMGVLLLHAAERVLDGGVAPGHAAGERAAFLDPAAQALGGRYELPLGQVAGRRAEALDRHQLADHFGIAAGVAQRDVAAERMRDDRHRRQVLLVDELREVVDEFRHAVIAVRWPFAVAVAAQVRGDHVPVLAQCGGHPVPGAAVIPAAMQQQQRRRAFIAPVDVVQAQSLREIAVRRRARHGRNRRGG